MSTERKAESAIGTEDRETTWRPSGTAARVGGLALVLLALVAAEPAVAACPSSIQGSLQDFINNLFTFVTVGGAIAAGIAAAGAWGMSQTTSDPQKKSQYKDWRNDAGKTGIGLFGFGMIWDVATGLIPSSATGSGNPADCVSAFHAVPVEPVALATDVAVLLG